MNDKKNLLLTFVLPCYNVEKYVQQCLDSIYECDLQENQFEVLCINDCSPDNTQSILEMNQKKHFNLRIIIHEGNKGLGGARNTGIREAKGTFLWFIDTDDVVVGDRLCKAFKKAVDEELDVLCFNYQRIDDCGNVVENQPIFNEMDPQDGYSFSESAFGSNGIVYHMGFVWRFVYRTDYLRTHQLIFPEHVCWEDTVFMPKSVLEAERVAAVSDVMYSYRVNPQSISGIFGRVYPAKLIYEFAFCAGLDLLHFSGEVKKDELKQAFRKTAIHKYFNGYSIHLLRTSKEERKKFYQMVKERGAEISEVKPYLILFNKILLNPAFGPILASICSMLYKLKHRK